jgi:hypothetical protein
LALEAARELRAAETGLWPRQRAVRRQVAYLAVADELLKARPAAGAWPPAARELARCAEAQKELVLSHQLSVQGSRAPQVLRLLAHAEQVSPVLQSAQRRPGMC